MPDGLNKVMLIGNLGTEPEMRYTANGAAVTTFRMAVARSYNGDGGRKEETEWFTVVAWQKLAELISQHLTKGRKVYVEGRLQSRQWDGPDGTKRYRTEVVASQLIFLDRQNASRDDGEQESEAEMFADELPFE